MKRALVTLALVSVLDACGRPQASSVEALAADPVRLKLLRSQCVEDRATVGESACQRVAEASRQRFFSGRTGPDEYSTLADLPPIPATFDAPAPEANESGVPATAVGDAR